MPVMTYRQALNDTLGEELARDKNVVLMGEEIGKFQGSYRITEGLQTEFGKQRVVDTPIAADERGIDLRQVQGTGPRGRIIKENIESFQPATDDGRRTTDNRQPTISAPAAPTAVPAPMPTGEVTPLGRMRRAIARAMNESKPGVPHIYVTVEIDMGAAMQLRKQINDGGAADVKVSVNDLVVKAAAKALAKLPAVNNSFSTTTEGQPRLVKNAGVHISVAVYFLISSVYRFFARRAKKR